MPPGFEAYETGDGLVVLRKMIPCLVTSKEVTAVCTALKENAKARSAYVDARGDAITVFMPDIDVEEGPRTFPLGLRLPRSSARHG